MSSLLLPALVASSIFLTIFSAALTCRHLDRKDIL